MDEYELVITNTFIGLSKGEFSKALFDLGYKDISVERVFHPEGRASFPPDIVIFSRCFNHFFLIEIKVITTTAIDSGQHESYGSLTAQSFREQGFNFEEASFCTSISYISPGNFAEQVMQKLKEASIEEVLLSYDFSSFIIKKVGECCLSQSDLNDVLTKGIELGISDAGKVPRYIAFNDQTNNYLVAKFIIPALLALCVRKRSASTEEVCRNSVTRIYGMWNRFSHDYQRRLINKTEQVLQFLQGQTDMGEVLSYTAANGGTWSLDIFDVNQRPSYQKQKKIKELLDSAAENIRDLLSLVAVAH